MDQGEKHHKWATEQVENITGPLLVCEPVLTEAMFLLKRLPAAQMEVLNLLENGALTIQFSLAENTLAIKTLLHKYADGSISLADACVVRMSELNNKHAVFTLDSDFHIYRKHSRETIQLIFQLKDSRSIYTIKFSQFTNISHSAHIFITNCN